MKIDDLDKMGVKMWEDNQPKTLVNKVFDEELFNDAVRYFSELGRSETGIMSPLLFCTSSGYYFEIHNSNK